MTEADFWVSLEYRICREFQGMREDRLRRTPGGGLLLAERVAVIDRTVLPGKNLTVFV